MKSKIKYLILWLIITFSLLYGKREPDRPEWLKEELKKYRFVPQLIRYLGDKSYWVETGKLESWSNINEKVNPGTPEEMAREFLKRHRNEFGFKEDLQDLKLAREPLGPEGFYRVEFYQVYKDIPLYGNEVIVNLKSDGTILGKSKFIKG